MPVQHSIRLAIADDHGLFRRGLALFFASLKEEPFALIGEAANGKEAIALVNTLQPSVVLMDVVMPEMNGIAATAIIKKTYPQVRILALSYSDGRESVLAMIEAGADGYVLKNTEPEELTHAIKTVCRGDFYFTPAINMHLITWLKENKTREQTALKKVLTHRETEVLQLIYEGKKSKEIAASLYVSKRTIDSTREHIMRKAGVKSVLQLLRYALKEKLLKE